MYLNSVTVIGNITKDIELKVLPNGTKIANFSVATNRTWYNDKKEKMEEVEFHNIVAFGNQAENIAKYMTKGSNILIEGRLKTQSWEDTATQKKMYRTEIIAEKVQFGYNKEKVAQEPKTDTESIDYGSYDDVEEVPEKAPF